MREIVLDTETTGLSPEAGHRIVEIGAVELINGIPTGKSFWHYINPERDVPADAVAIHGITTESLQGKPLFDAVADEFMEFIGHQKTVHDRLVIHNAGFDVKFLNWELSRIGYGQLLKPFVIDTLDMARRKFPGSPASLDALCKRFSIDNSHRNLHGALRDAELLAGVYAEMTGRRQPTLIDMVSGEAPKSAMQSAINSAVIQQKKQRAPRIFAPAQSEIAAHQEFLEEIINPLWKAAGQA